MTAAEMRAEIRDLRLLPGGAWPRAMRLLEEVAEMLERLEAERGEEPRDGGRLDGQAIAALRAPEETK